MFVIQNVAKIFSHFMKKSFDNIKIFSNVFVTEPGESEKKVGCGKMKKKRLARTFGLDEREVKKSLSRLRKKELIEIYKNQDDKNSLIIALRKDNECYRITSKEFVMDETMIATLSIGRNDKGYAKFRKDVLERDEYTCQICGGNEKLEVHHIKPYAGYKNLRTTVSNGITLCEKCHKKAHRKRGSECKDG